MKGSSLAHGADSRAAATTTFKMGTAVLLVLQRDPFTLAKATSTLDVVSGGRLLVGVGVGGNLVAGDQVVVACAGDHVIVALVAVERVGSGSVAQEVVPGVPVETVVGGATEETIIARVGEGIITSIGTAEDPLSFGECLHRCDDLGDFFDVIFAPDGRVWAALVDGCVGCGGQNVNENGVMVEMRSGPSRRNGR